jgi:hypothetical protein
MATISSIALNWLQLLEKEFDLSFVDCDTCLAHVFSCLSDSEEGLNANSFNELLVNICNARQHLTELSAAFTQLVHKTITIANHNQNLTVFTIHLFYLFIKSLIHLLITLTVDRKTNTFSVKLLISFKLILIQLNIN